MLEHDFTADQVARITSPDIRNHLCDIADDFVYAYVRGGVYFETGLRSLLTAPLGELMLNGAEAVVDERSPAETSGRATVFIYGTSCMYRAINECDLRLAARLHLHANSLLAGTPSHNLVYQMEKPGSGPTQKSDIIIQEGERGLNLSGLADILAEIEELVVSNDDFKPYLQIGGGWLAYQALMSI